MNTYKSLLKRLKSFFNKKSIKKIYSKVEILKLGARGESVKKLQEILTKLGYQLLPDGKFGNVTEAAIKDFQANNGLVADGIVGPLTLKKLRQAASTVSEPSISTPGKIDTRSYLLNSDIYYRQTITKKAIVIHHTAGHTVDKNGNDNMTHVNGWNKSGIHVGAAFSISYHGKIYQHFDPIYWIYHLGLKTTTNKKMNSESIGIELCNEGPLRKMPDGTFKWFDGKISYLRPKDIPVQNPWRGHEYWAPYSDAQMKALIWLVNHLCKTYYISKKLVEHDEFDESLLDGNFSGIYTHTNVRKDKTDVSPAFNYEDFKTGVYI